MSFDILSQEIDEAWESASTLILTTVLSEKAKIMKKSDLLPEEIDELPPLTELD
jgi:hypothetical protein